jgi:myo-inositol-1(or 4)-monophosphatase
MKQLLIKALKKAGKVQQEHFHQNHQVEEKESISSVVTEVDLMCDRLISNILQAEHPDHNILSEESGLIDKGSRFTWVIDPLDGTSNYAAGIAWFGVLIALFENNTPILAGAYRPMTDEMYIAEAGKWAYLNGKKLSVSNLALKNSLFAFAVDYSDDDSVVEVALNKFWFLMQHARNIRSTNSLIDFLLVAEGKFGGAMNLFTKIWDIAAPWLLIKEAGGELLSLSGDPIAFDLTTNGTNNNYPVMAGSKAILENFLT